MAATIKKRTEAVLSGGVFIVLALSTLVMAHPGGMSPPAHPPPAVHPHHPGAANLGMVHMSPTPANFGQTVSGVATTQGQTISQDAKSGITGKSLSGIARQHGQIVSGEATGTIPPPDSLTVGRGPL